MQKMLQEEKLKLAAEAYRQAHDPKCIANRIGDKLWYSGGHCLGGEFKKITLVADDDSEFSVIYPSWRYGFDLVGGCNVSKVLCTAPETGIEFSFWLVCRSS